MSGDVLHGHAQLMVVSGPTVPQRMGHIVLGEPKVGTGGLEVLAERRRGEREQASVAAAWHHRLQSMSDQGDDIRVTYGDPLVGAGLGLTQTKGHTSVAWTQAAVPGVGHVGTGQSNQLAHPKVTVEGQKTSDAFDPLSFAG